YLLEALELHKARLVSRRCLCGNDAYEIDTVRVPRRWNYARPPIGIEILNNDLAPVREFDLLYNAKGYLIAVFPVFSGGGKLVSGYYFDFTSYYFEIPSFDDPQAKEKWEDFVYRRVSDNTLIQVYLNSLPDHVVMGKYQRFKQKDYVYAELKQLRDILGGEFILPSFMEFDAEEIMLDRERFPQTGWLDRLFFHEDGGARVIFPVFPTLYSPAFLTHWECDVSYMMAVYYGAKELKGAGDEKIMVDCLGSGIDAWIAAEASGKEVYGVGINPFEIASSRFVAKQGRFNLVARRSNNIISVWNRPVFGSMRFKLVCANAPFYNADRNRTGMLKRAIHLLLLSLGKIEPEKLANLWDSDAGEFIKRFAKGLAKSLYPDEGVAIMLNTGYPQVRRALVSRGIDIVRADNTDPDGDSPGVLYILRLKGISGSSSLSTNRELRAASQFSMDYVMRNVSCVMNNFRSKIKDDGSFVPRAVASSSLAVKHLIIHPHQECDAVSCAKPGIEEIMRMVGLGKKRNLIVLAKNYQESDLVRTVWYKSYLRFNEPSVGLGFHNVIKEFVIDADELVLSGGAYGGCHLSFYLIVLSIMFFHSKEIVLHFPYRGIYPYSKNFLESFIKKNLYTLSLQADYVFYRTFLDGMYIDGTLDSPRITVNYWSKNHDLSFFAGSSAISQEKSKIKEDIIRLKRDYVPVIEIKNVVKQYLMASRGENVNRRERCLTELALSVNSLDDVRRVIDVVLAVSQDLLMSERTDESAVIERIRKIIAMLAQSKS
ncbi:MAG: hypothetical protein ABH858_06810, partial [Candidatus Omnitrophota bacterium]